MRLGTKIKMDDGRVGTVVYNSIIGVGVKWGRHDPDPDDFVGTTGNLLRDEVPDDWQWEPDALLREPWDGCEGHGFAPAECVGEKFDVIEEE